MTWIAQAVSGGLNAAAGLRADRAAVNSLTEEAGVVGRQANRDEEAQRREARQMLGEQAASMAQAGGGVDEGILRQSAANAELDALNIRYGGQMKARGLLSEARTIKKNSKLKAAAALLSGGSQAYATRRAG